MDTNFSRRDFLRAAGLASVAGIVASVAPAAMAQTTQQVRVPEQPLRLEMIREGKQPELKFDIRQLRREMGVPATNGPFAPVIIRARKNPDVNNWTYYEVIVDTSLLQRVKLTEAEIVAEENRRGIKLPRNVDITQARETIAFVGQLNIEIYMTPAQMRAHIRDYSNVTDDATLIRMRDSWRDEIRLDKVNTQTLSSVVDHLIKWHGFESVNQNGVPLLRAVIEAKEESKYVIGGHKKSAALLPQERDPNSEPTTRPA